MVYMHQWKGSSSVQVMACCLLITWTNDDLLKIGLLEINLIAILLNTTHSIQENVFQTVICNLPAIMFGPQCTNIPFGTIRSPKSMLSYVYANHSPPAPQQITCRIQNSANGGHEKCPQNGLVISKCNSKIDVTQHQMARWKMSSELFIDHIKVLQKNRSKSAPMVGHEKCSQNESIISIYVRAK